MSKSKRKDLGQPWFWLIVGGILATAAVVTLLSFSAIDSGDIKTSSYTYTPQPATPAPEENMSGLDECYRDCGNRWWNCVTQSAAVVQACIVTLQATGAEDFEAQEQCGALDRVLDNGCSNYANDCRRACENVT